MRAANVTSSNSGGDAEHCALDRRGEERRLNGQTVHRAPDAPDDEAVMRVHVDQPAGDRVEPEVALDPRDGALPRGVGAPEPEGREDGLEPRLAGAVYQQVDVALAAHPAVPLPVAFPLETGDPLVAQRFAQSLDQRARCYPRRGAPRKRGTGAGAGGRRNGGGAAHGCALRSRPGGAARFIGAAATSGTHDSPRPLSPLE